MLDTVRGLDNVRLEQEIAECYYSGFRDAPGVVLQESGVLGLLWAEFDARFVAGLIDVDPLTGFEPDGF